MINSVNWKAIVFSLTTFVSSWTMMSHKNYKDLHKVHDKTAVHVTSRGAENLHNEVIKWKHFPRYWPFVPGIHRSPVNSPHKGQWRGALMFSVICAWINAWVNNREAGDLRRHRAHYDVIVMDSDLLEGTKGHTFQTETTTGAWCCTSTI